MDAQRRRLLMRRSLPVAFLAAALVSLGACGLGRHPGEGSGSTLAVTNAVYEGALNGWIDHPEEDLVAAWGVPERSQRLTDGGQALEYRHVNSEGAPLCTTLFTSDVYGVIRTWAYRGTDCRIPHLGDYGRESWAPVPPPARGAGSAVVGAPTVEGPAPPDEGAAPPAGTGMAPGQPSPR